MKRGGPLKRTTGLKPRSAKTAAKYVERRKLVARLLDERPVCEHCGAQRATEIHETRSRARGGSILDESNCMALCHRCHTDATEGRAPELLRHSWDPDGATP